MIHDLGAIEPLVADAQDRLDVEIFLLGGDGRARGLQGDGNQQEGYAQDDEGTLGCWSHGE